MYREVRAGSSIGYPVGHSAMSEPGEIIHSQESKAGNGLDLKSNLSSGSLEYLLGTRDRYSVNYSLGLSSRLTLVSTRSDWTSPRLAYSCSLRQWHDFFRNSNPTFPGRYYDAAPTRGWGA